MSKAIAVITAVVLGSAMMVGGVGVIKKTVLPTTTTKVESLFGISGDIGGGGGGDTPVQPKTYHMIVDGDSLNAVRTGSFDVDECNWHTHVARELGMKYEIYTNADGDRWYKDNLAQSWSMVAKNTDYINSGKPANLASDERVNALVARVNEVEEEGDAAFVILNGGTNDACQYDYLGNNGFKVELGNINSPHNEDTYYGALQLWFDKLQQRIPNAKIVFLGAPYVYNEGYYIRTGGTHDIVGFREAQKAVCQKYGIQYVNLRNLMHANENTEDDTNWSFTYLDNSGIHYNTPAGTQDMVNAIVSQLR